MEDTLEWKEQASTHNFFKVDHLGQKVGAFMPLHRHDYAEMLLVEAGSGVHQVNGERQSVTRGDLVMIRPFIDSHCISPSDADLSILHICIRASSLRFLETRYFNSRSSFWGGAGKTPTIIPLSLHQQSWIQAASKKLALAPQNRLEIERFLLNLVAILSDVKNSEDSPQLNDWLKRACRMIQDPRYFAMGSRGMIVLSNRSREHVARELKKRLGKTPTQIVNEARMSYAASQLCTTSLPIIDIALECGFESLSHFYKIFKNEYDLTPRQYRTMVQLQLTQTRASANGRAPSSEVRNPGRARTKINLAQMKITLQEEKHIQAG